MVYKLTNDEIAELAEMGISEPTCIGIIWEGPNSTITVQGYWNGALVVGDWQDSEGSADIKWRAA